jgi:hypothetical protein
MILSFYTEVAIYYILNISSEIVIKNFISILLELIRLIIIIVIE